MKTSDKEIDDLFAAQLNNLEAEPDAAVWENISIQLNGKAKKKNIIPVLRMAAGIIVVLSAGLLFWPKNKQPVKNQFPQKVVKQKTEQIQPENNQPEIITEKKEVLVLSAKNMVVKEAFAHKKTNKKSVLKTLVHAEPIAAEITTEKLIAQNKPELQPELPKNNISPAKIAVVPDVSVSLKTDENEQLLINNDVKPIIYADKRSIASNNNRKHKSIRTMGDLVNLVMAKVDKRPDKLIEFTNSDDGDESDVTGINLGFISIKKEK